MEEERQSEKARDENATRDGESGSGSAVRVSCRQLVRYWRACVADVGLGKGRFRQRDLPPDNRALLELSKEELLRGRVGAGRVKRLFRGLDEKLEHVQVCTL